MGKGEKKFSADDLGGFNFASASPQIADLMRRLYELRKRCGYMEDEETKKERLRLEKEARDQYAKMDSFEKQKANTVRKIEELQDLLQAKKRNELSKKDEVRLRKGLDEVQEMFGELEELQLSASAGTGIWAKLSKKIPEDIRLKREEDVKEVQRLIAGLIKMKNKYILGLEETDTKYSESKFESVDNLQQMSEEELLRKPTIDISEGLAQIKEKKHQIYNLLDTIDKQLDGMKEQATAFKSEIQSQMQILDKIDKDVEKYTEQLEKSNKNLDATLKKVGGPTNLLFIAIGLIVIAAIFAIGYFAISTYVKL